MMARVRNLGLAGALLMLAACSAETPAARHTDIAAAAQSAQQNIDRYAAANAAGDAATPSAPTRATPPNQHVDATAPSPRPREVTRQRAAISPDASEPDKPASAMSDAEPEAAPAPCATQLRVSAREETGPAPGNAADKSGPATQGAASPAIWRTEKGNPC